MNAPQKLAFILFIFVMIAFIASVFMAGYDRAKNKYRDKKKYNNFDDWDEG